MAHNLYRGSMMYVGETPWHGLGVNLPKNATWAQCREAVGFYQAEERPLFVSGLAKPLTDWKAIVRADTGDTLSIVGPDYGLVQFDTLAETVMEAIGSAAIFHTAGLLGEKGERGWLLGEIPEPLRVKGDGSEIRRFFLAAGGHDGGFANRLQNVATRVVCQNTLGMAMGERGGFRQSIRHTLNANDRVKAAGVAFGAIVRSYERFGAVANLLASTRFSDKQFEGTLDRVMPIPDDNKTHPRLTDARDEITSLWQGRAKGMSGIQGTAWGALQAWTEYVDHYRLARGMPAGSAERMDYTILGAGASLKGDAHQAIVLEAGLSSSIVNALNA